MNRHFAKISILTVLAGILATGAALAQTNNRRDPIALKNWKVPSIETMLRTYGDSPNTHFVNTGAFVFQSTIPCRVVDTRTANGAFGGPIFTAGQTRTYSMAAGGLCGSSFPANIAAVSLNITVTQTAGTGFVTGYATGGSLPTVSNVTFIGANVTISNAAIIPTAGGAASNINIFSSQGTHVILDINGIFLNNLSANNDQLQIVTSIAGAAAILGQNNSSTAGSHAIGGFESGAGVVHGVQGQISGAALGGSSGVHGISERISNVYAVRGDMNGTSFSGTPGFSVPAGVLGKAERGVLGYGEHASSGGVVGAEINAAGTALGAWAVLALNDVGLFVGSGGGNVTGNFNITGTLTKGGGAFKIDHPLDPENKYLYHSFVESPDMMNIYNGNVFLDAAGEAVVLLPDWFESLNRDFRYQLTSIGAPGPNLYIAEEVSGNQFRIAGGKPGSKVSWTVTGIRHDRFADANRIPVEQAKIEAERGFYLHPDLYGQPDTKNVQNVKFPKLMQEMRAAQTDR